VTRPSPLAFYAFLTGLIEPVAPALLRRRAGQGKEDPARLGERLGRAGAGRPDGPLVWLHGVSVGETASLLPLIEALWLKRPDLSLLVTSGTITSAQMLAKRLPPRVIHQYAPIDTPQTVDRFLRHWRPNLAVFAESELWPNLIQAAHAGGVKLALVSARITEKTARSWARFPVAAHEIFSSFDLILPQDDATDARIRRLGGTPAGKLNLKLAGEPLPVDELELARLRKAVGGRKVILAASTHPGEDEIVVEAFQAAVRDPAEALLILAPRHPDRGPDLAQRFGASRRAAGEPPSGPIHVADTLGELGLFFRLADVVVMGGAFLPGIGGHNPLEPARIGRPILTGPHPFNAAEPYADLLAEAAAIEASDTPALARHLRGLLDNPVIARRMGEAARAYADRQGAALATALDLLDPLLPA
jgi:3-deoxy-D-manno-octulosonic-acid transferase